MSDLSITLLNWSLVAAVWIVLLSPAALGGMFGYYYLRKPRPHSRDEAH